MRGESTSALYERVMEQLGQDIELEDMESNTVGIVDNDLQR